MLVYPCSFEQDLCEGNQTAALAVKRRDVAKAICSTSVR